MNRSHEFIGCGGKDYTGLELTAAGGVCPMFPKPSKSKGLMVFEKNVIGLLRLDYQPGPAIHRSHPPAPGIAAA